MVDKSAITANIYVKRTFKSLSALSLICDWKPDYFYTGWLGKKDRNNKKNLMQKIE